MRSRLTDSTSFKTDSSNMHQSIKKCSICKYHLRGIKRCSQSRTDSFCLAIFHNHLHHFILPHIQPIRMLQNFPPICRKFHSVTLSSRTPHGRSFRKIQHPELYGTAIRNNGCHPSQSIYFTHNLPFCNTAYSRIT